MCFNFFSHWVANVRLGLLCILLSVFTISCRTDTKTRTQAQNLLVNSVIKVNYEGVRQAIRMGADVNQRLSWGATPFFSAILNGDMKIIRTLLAAGAEVNIRAEGGLTPLIVASENGMTEIVELLLKKKADFSAESEAGFTALRSARENKHEAIVLLLTRAGAIK